MDAKMVWLFIFVLLYWAYCIFWGVKGAMSAKTASDYFIAGRRLSLWVFVLAATATSFSGWTFMGHPGLLYRDGFQYAYASFYAITIPFTGVMFLILDRKVIYFHAIWHLFVIAGSVCQFLAIHLLQLYHLHDQLI